jgi:hypothetical protein
MLFNKGLALSGAMLAAAIPAPVVAAELVAPTKVARVFTVSNLTELRTALAEAQKVAGAEIRLNPGNYGALIWNYKSYPLGRVYVVAATRTKPVFSSIQAASSNNMSFHGLKVTGGGGKLVQLNGSQNMSFTGGEISGFTENGNPWDESATALQVRFSKNVLVQDNKFSDVRAAIYTQRSERVTLRYNRVISVREGFNMVSTDDLQVRGNHFSNFYPRYDLREHPDAMQFWTSGEVKGSNRVRILENFIAMGGKRAIQGIFGGSEVAGVRHSDWEVTRNVYYGSSVHGMSFGAIDGLKVSNNVIVASPHADVNNSIRSADGTESGGYLPRFRVRLTTGVVGWNNVLMTNGVSRDAGSQVTQYDNWDIFDAMGWGGVPWTDLFAAGRPTSEAPALSEFITKSPSAARTRNGGVLTPFVHGVRPTTKDQTFAEVRTILGN